MNRCAILVVDLAFGDCGKGTIVDFLTRSHCPHTVVRFNGGPQAGHNVVTSDGRHHTFSQFGSGTIVPGVRTLLSRFMLIEPYALFNEAAHLREIGVTDPLNRLVVDSRCLVITPPQQAANRLRELARGSAAHGTCGMGVGEAMCDSIEHPHLAIHAGDLSHRSTVATKLRALRELKLEQLRDILRELDQHPRARFSLDTLFNPEWLDTAAGKYASLGERVSTVDQAGVCDLLQQPGAVVFEGAQGVLLDEAYGFHPYTTWSTTTFANADTLLDECDYQEERVRVGVLRSYFTRHGPGPFVTESPLLASHLPEQHNDERGWQGSFRVGGFDAVAARYALSITGPVDALAMTHLDRLDACENQICYAYTTDQKTPFFEFAGGLVRNINVRRPMDLAHQHSLGMQLHDCRPIYARTATADAEEFVARVEQELQVEVAIESAGPTAREKRIKGAFRGPVVK